MWWAPFIVAAPQLSQNWTLTLLGGLDLSALIILSLGAVAGAVWTWLSLDPALPLRSRLVVVGARTVALLVVFAMLLQPTLRLRFHSESPARVAVVLDASGSMRRGVDGPRLDRAIAAASSVERELKRRGGVVEWYCFADDALSIATPSAAAQCPFDGQGSDIRGALEHVAREVDRAGPLSAMVLISDGADTARLVARDGEPQLGWATSLGSPIHTIAIAGPSADRDVAVEQVRADRFAFTRAPTSVDVSLKAVGADGESVEVLLLRAGSVLRRATCEIVAGAGHVVFSFTPLAIGEHVLEIALSPTHTDDIPENDRAYLSLSAIRDKYRLLHLAGRPSWDQRFVRGALKDWPKMDVVSFYVLRSELQSETHGSSGMVLIPFPTDELFASHLQEFDIVVMQDMDLAMVGIDRYLPQIAEFVNEGGGLVYVNGPEGFPAAAVTDERLRSILPVEPLPPGTAVKPFDEAAFRPQILPAGRNHPLLALSESAQESAQLWQALPPIEGVARVARLAPSALALVGHPTLTVDGGPSPVFAVRDVGQGRTLAITTPSLWRWGFSGPMSGGPHDIYSALWRRIVAWMTKDASLERLRVSVTPSPARAASPMTIEVEVLDETYQPIPSAPIELELTWTQADKSPGKHVVAQFADGQGKYRLEWTPTAAGPHGLAVRAPAQAMSTEEELLVQPRSDEVSHLEPVPSLLELLAHQTEGTFQRGQVEPAKLAGLDGSANRVVSHVDIPLWCHPAALLLLLLVLGLEWLVRRRLGLL